MDQTDPEQSPPVSAVPPPAAPTGAAELQAVTQEVKRIIVGQDRVVERLLVGLLARGHLLLEGVPGLAKTLAMETLAKAVGGTFARIQFTPDLLPADITGTRVWRQSAESFDVELGPVFVNFLLADEINRAPAKVQSALLEVMAERKIPIGGKTFPLPSPFLVMATQNPIEQEGVYQLPEAQRDRFLFKLNVDYPSPEEEREIIYRMGVKPPEAKAILSTQDLLRLQDVAHSLGGDVHDCEFGLTRMGLTFGPGIKRNRLALENRFCEELLLKAWVTQHRSDFHVGGIIGTQTVPM